MDGRGLVARAVYAMYSRGRTLVFALLAASSLLAALPSPAAQAADKLPLMLVEAPPGTDGPLMLLLTGDGNWASFPRGIAEASAGHGAPVLALLSRDYMARVHPLTPARLAADLAGAVRRQLEAWQRTDIVLVGYSRGADWAPFVLNRWPADLRSRVKAIVFVGLSNKASFEFHFEDLFRDVARPTDVPIAPEMAKLAGIPMTCVYGTEESTSFCRHPVPGMQSLQHPGGHRVKDDKKLIAYLLGVLGIAPETAPPSPVSGSPTSP